MKRKTKKSFLQVLAINAQISKLQHKRDTIILKTQQSENWDYHKFNTEYMKSQKNIFTA